MHAASLQWEKLRKTDKLVHLTRWFDFLSQLSPLRELLESHAPRKAVAADSTKDAAAGKGAAKAAGGTLSSLVLQFVVVV